MEVGVAFGMVAKAAMVGGAILRDAAEMIAGAAVEALDHAVGLRSKRAGEAVENPVRGADPVDGVLARRFITGLALFVDGKAIGERGAVVGQDGVDFEWEAVAKAGGGDGGAIGEDFQVDKAGGAVGDVLAGFPPGHGAGVDAEFAGQRGVGRPAPLDVGAGARGGGIGVKPEIH